MRCFGSVPEKASTPASAIHPVLDSLKNLLNGAHTDLGIEQIKRPLPTERAVRRNHPARSLVFRANDLLGKCHHLGHSHRSVRLLMSKARLCGQASAEGSSRNVEPLCHLG